MHRGVILFSLVLAGCPSDPPKQEPAASIATTAAAPVPTRRPPKPAAPKPKSKAFAPTEGAALGTLPEGVGIAVGESAPDFELMAHSKGKQSLDSLLKRGELLLVFYRGGW